MWWSCLRDERHTQGGADHLLYALVDELVAQFMPVVEKIDDEIRRLVDRMIDVMVEKKGVGLAAPQIGLGIRLAVIDVTSGKNPEAKLVLATNMDGRASPLRPVPVRTTRPGGTPGAAPIAVTSFWQQVAFEFVASGSSTSGRFRKTGTSDMPAIGTWTARM